MPEHRTLYSLLDSFSKNSAISAASLTFFSVSLSSASASMSPRRPSYNLFCLRTNLLPAAYVNKRGAYLWPKDNFGELSRERLVNSIANVVGNPEGI